MYVGEHVLVSVATSVFAMVQQAVRHKQVNNDLVLQSMENALRISNLKIL